MKVLIKLVVASVVLSIIIVQYLFNKDSARKACLDLQTRIYSGMEQNLGKQAELDECLAKYFPEQVIGNVESFGVLGNSSNAPEDALAYYSSGADGIDTVTIYDDAIEIYNRSSYPVGTTEILFADIISLSYSESADISVRYRESNNRVNVLELMVFGVNMRDSMQRMTEEKKLNMLLNYLWEKHKNN